MSTRTRAQRADGALNRTRILNAARQAFADPDADVSMAEIARRSGLGSGTLYRHFATRRDLLGELYVDDVNAICDAASADTGDVRARLVSWLYQFFDFVTNKRHVAAELLQHTDETDPVFTSSRARITAAGRPLLETARASGAVTSDLSIDQILDMLVAIAKIPEPVDYVRPILIAAVEGL